MKKLFAALVLVTIFSANMSATPVKISFKLNMKDVKIKDKKTVGISGDADPLSWKKLYALADDDNDGIYTGEIMFDNADKIEFKFRYDENWERGENRIVKLKGKTTETVTEAYNVRPFVGYFNYDYNEKIVPMAERMRLGEQPINGISMCILRGGAVDTLANWGQRDAEKKLPMTANTLFQLGGLGQPLIGFALLRAHEQKILDIDKPINDYLKRWKMPLKKGETESKATLRDLLTGKVTFQGKSKPDGYEVGKALPNVVQILNGESPSQENKAKYEETKNFSFYAPLIAQIVLEDVYNAPLAEVMKKLVLDPLSMTNSFYALELTEGQRNNFAVGYDKKGKAVKGDYLRYPEQGFSGLWSTTPDYAKFVNCLIKAARGEDNALMSQNLAKEAMQNVNGQRSMIFPTGDGGGNYFGGAPMGYRTQVEFNVQENWVSVVLMNSWENWRFMLQAQAKAQDFATRK